MTEHKTLGAALAAVQADMPSVHKGKTANVGQYRYTYADRAESTAPTPTSWPRPCCTRPPTRPSRAPCRSAAISPSRSGRPSPTAAGTCSDA